MTAQFLLAAHIAAYSMADDVILRDVPGSHPYLTGLGIFGGMYSFKNPLQGSFSYPPIHPPPHPHLHLHPHPHPLRVATFLPVRWVRYSFISICIVF